MAAAAVDLIGGWDGCTRFSKLDSRGCRYDHFRNLVGIPGHAVIDRSHRDTVNLVVIICRHHGS